MGKETNRDSRKMRETIHREQQRPRDVELINGLIIYPCTYLQHQEATELVYMYVHMYVVSFGKVGQVCETSNQVEVVYKLKHF